MKAPWWSWVSLILLAALFFMLGWELRRLVLAEGIHWESAWSQVHGTIQQLGRS